jgi:hypothetical protein
MLEALPQHHWLVQGLESVVAVDCHLQLQFHTFEEVEVENLYFMSKLLLLYSC